MVSLRTAESLKTRNHGPSSPPIKTPIAGDTNYSNSTLPSRKLLHYPKLFAIRCDMVHVNDDIAAFVDHHNKVLVFEEIISSAGADNLEVVNERCDAADFCVEGALALACGPIDISSIFANGNQP